MKKRDPNDTEINKRIRTVRLHRGISQTQLGEKLGVTFQQVQKYENGTNRISAGRLQRIADILGIPIAFFYTGKIEKIRTNASPPDFDLFQTGDVIRLVRAYSKIKNGPIRAALLRLAVALSPEGAS